MSPEARARAAHMQRSLDRGEEERSSLDSVRFQLPSSRATGDTEPLLVRSHMYVLKRNELL